MKKVEKKTLLSVRIFGKIFFAKYRRVCLHQEAIDFFYLIFFIQNCLLKRFFIFIFASNIYFGSYWRIKSWISTFFWVSHNAKMTYTFVYITTNHSCCNILTQVGGLGLLLASGHWISVHPGFLPWGILVGLVEWPFQTKNWQNQ